MLKYGKAALWVLGLAWGLLAFLASNSPDEVQQRTSGWLALPIVSSLPTTIIEFAAQPFVLALSFLLIGGFIGWKLRSVRRKPKDDGWYDLGVEMSLMADRIEDLNYRDVDHERMNADLDVLRLNTIKRGLPFPSGDGFKFFQSYETYLRRVSALLKSGHLNEAKLAAKHHSENPPTLAS